MSCTSSSATEWPIEYSCHSTGWPRASSASREAWARLMATTGSASPWAMKIGVPRSRIVLAGFSQGGAITLHTGLRQAEPLAGLLALSTYLPLADIFAAERHGAAASTPI